MKQCKVCKLFFQETEMRHGLICKECYKPIANEQAKNWRKKHSMQYNETRKKYLEKNHDILLKKRRIYNDKEINRKRRNEVNRKYTAKNREKIYEYNKQWRKRNIEKVKRAREKRKNNINYKISSSISRRIRKTLKSNKNSQNWEKIVGYTIEELKNHLEKQFESWMNWNNYGKVSRYPKVTWQIDHIRPVHTFNIRSLTDTELKECWKLSNLRPLDSYENNRREKRIKMNYKLQVKELLKQELDRQENEIDLIASENYASQDVLDACGSCIQNKYSEGWIPFEVTEDGYKKTHYQRFYAGCSIVDKIEKLTVDLVCKAFGTKYANVQSHCGSSANLGVYVAATRYFKCKPDELTIISHSLDAGSHLTHGSKASISGKWFNTKQFDTDENGLFNYEEMERLIKETNGPIVLVVGFSAYPREVKFDEIAKCIKDLNKEIIVLCDTSHISGLVVTGEHQNPFDYDWGKAHLVLTSTTHKTLRGPRHAIITTDDSVLASIIDKAVFPGINGGALQNMIAALGIAMSEALQPEFKQYIQQVKKNIQAMCEVFKEREVKMMTDGSDNHLILLDLKDEQFTGADLEKLLESIGVIANKNSVKGDTRPKMETSGLRLGTACITTRGANENDAKWIAHLVCNCIEILRGTFDYEGSGLLRVREDGSIDEESDIKILVIEDMSRKVKNWCKDHPIYKED